MPKLNVVLSWLAVGLVMPAALPAAALAQTTATVVEGTDSVTGNTLPAAEASAEMAPYPMVTSPIMEGYTPPAANSGYYDNHGLPVPAGSVPPTVSDIVNRVNMDVSGSVPPMGFAPMQQPNGTPPMPPMAGMPPMNGMPAAPMMAPRPPSVNPDVDFVRGMLAHHQAAIFMAKQVIATGTDPYVKMLANDIVSAQDREIEWMKDWLAAYGPKDANAAAAKAVGTPPNHGVSATLPPIPAKEKAKKEPAKKKPAPKKPVKKAPVVEETPAAAKDTAPAEATTTATPAKEPAKAVPAQEPAKAPAQGASAAKTPAAVPAAEAPAAEASFSGNDGSGEEDMPTMPNAFGK